MSIQIPPIVVHAKDITHVKSDIEEYLGIVGCIKKCSIEEQDFAYIHFNEVQESGTIHSFLAKLKHYTFTIDRNNRFYAIESMYIDV